MPEHELLGPWLRRFLTEHIVTERNLARNTRSSYRDTFRLLLPFASRKVRNPVDRLTVRDLESSLVLKFLAHVEDDRGCSIRTRNQRLAGIKAFARFVGSRDPAHVEWCGHIRAIASKKSMQPSVGWLARPEMEAMLAVPDRKTDRGKHEYALLLFLYNTGARVSEITALRAGDVLTAPRHAVQLHGKGRKQRAIPLWPATATALRDWITDNDLPPDAPAFPNRGGRPMTRSGVADRLARAVTAATGDCPTLHGQPVSPHTLRHSTAMHLLQSGTDITVIALWLGHADPATTHQYLAADLATKQAALDRLAPPDVPPARFRADDQLLAFLDQL